MVGLSLAPPMILAKSAPRSPDGAEAGAAARAAAGAAGGMGGAGGGGIGAALVGIGAAIADPGGGGGGGGGAMLTLVVGGVIGVLCAPDPALAGRGGMTVPNKCNASF